MLVFNELPVYSGYVPGKESDFNKRRVQGQGLVLPRREERTELIVCLQFKIHGVADYELDFIIIQVVRAHIVEIGV